MSPRRGERTSEEREAARREREARRAAREGRPLPPEQRDPAVEHDLPAAEPPPVEPPAVEPQAVEPEPEHDPHATQQYDVAREWSDEAPADAPGVDAPAPDVAAEPPEEPGQADAEAADPAADPHATQQHDVTGDWSDDPAEPDRPAPLSAPAPDDHDATAAWGAEWTDEHATDAAAPSAAAERPLGTKRVAGRAHLPRVDRRGGRGGAGGSRRGRGLGDDGSRSRGQLARRIFAGLAVLLAVAVVWFLYSLFQPFAGAGKGTVVVTVPKGASVSDIGDLLEKKGVVSSSFFFRARATLSGDRGALKSGTFKLRRDMSYSAALSELTKTTPPVPTVTVTIPEGRSRREAASLARQDGLRGDYVAATRSSSTLNPRAYGAPRSATLEGFLFPATYQMARHAKVQALIDAQLAAFKRNFARVNLGYAKSRHLSAYDVLVIASMVEREVSVPKERPLVASVIYNRLKFHMPLGIDATLRFALNDWTSPLTQSQLTSPSPYNTRTRQGLPPGPIGSPGLASIEAAAHPARSNYLYYVVKPGSCGTHAFSTNFQQFTADANRYNHARQANGGKSPTKC